MLSMTAVVTMCLTGCFSIERGTLPSGDEHVLVRNYGWYIFNFLPVGCGNSSKNPHCPVVIFRDDVTMEKMQDRMLAAAQESGKTLSDLVYINDGDTMLRIPFFFFEIPIPYLLTYREIQLSGVLK